MCSIVFNPIYLLENKGLGNALRVALENATNELVARMDSDDISLPRRFESQLELFKKNGNIDIVGGDISEFVGEEQNITGIRTVQRANNQIRADMKRRCPMNHVSVMYKKSAVNKSGGYIDFPFNEDYYLWIRMMQNGCIFANTSDVVVNVRTGLDMAARRGGKTYFKSEKDIQAYMFKNGIISYPQYAYNVFIRFVAERLMPNSIRNRLFKFTRKENIEINNNEVGKRLNGDMDRSEYPQFSVAMSVYKNDNPEWFDKAIKSISIDQTIKPDEIVLVVDGPVPDSIHSVIDKYSKIFAGGGV